MFPTGRRRKVFRKIIKRKQGSPAPNTPTPSEQTLPYTATLESFPGQQEWANYYTGGYSQWREEQPDMWSQWQWPPHGWQPSKYQDAYWDESNPYHKYRYYKWDTSPEQATPEGKRPELRSPDTQSTLITRSSSGVSTEVEEAMEELQRCTTAEQLTFEQRMAEAGERPEHPTVETPEVPTGGAKGPTVETPAVAGGGISRKR